MALVGCGTTVQESLKINPALKTNIGQGRRVVILPFADYTDADSIESAYSRNLFVSECFAFASAVTSFTARKAPSSR